MIVRFLLALSLITFACSDSPTSEDRAAGPPAVIVTSDLSPYERKWFRLSDASVLDGELTATLDISGCSGDVSVELISSAAFLESFPVQSLSLFRYDDGDCDAIWSLDVSFDLTPIIDAHEASYGVRNPLYLRFISPEGDAILVEIPHHDRG